VLKCHIYNNFSLCCQNFVLSDFGVTTPNWIRHQTLYLFIYIVIITLLDINLLSNYHSKIAV
jgi:hypothetical protein